MKFTLQVPKVLTADCKMTAREYYDFRLMALTYKVDFQCVWTDNTVMVTTEVHFLSKCGYHLGLDY